MYVCMYVCMHVCMAYSLSDKKRLRRYNVKKNDSKFDRLQLPRKFFGFDDVATRATCKARCNLGRKVIKDLVKTNSEFWAKHNLRLIFWECYVI